MSLKQPIGQKRLTNVALVRYKKKGKRFEIACYKNKVVNWRAGVEKDLDEVLQTTAVFANVSKGVLAKAEDLLDVFGTADEEQICVRILNEGDYQVSDKERDLEFDSLFKDVASILAEKTVNPQSQRPYTISMLERALRDIHFSVDPKRGAKQQALEVLPKLRAVIPIERARMRLRAHVPHASGPEALAAVLRMLREAGADIEQQDRTPTQATLLCVVEPSRFRDIHAAVQQATRSAGQVEVVSLGVTQQGEAHASLVPAAAAAAGAGAGAAAAAGAGAAVGAGAGAAAAGAGQGGGGAAAELGGQPAARAPADAAQSSGAQPQPASALEQAGAAAAAQADVLYARGPVAALPEAFESRRERFSELDTLQPGWRVELVRRRGGSTIDAVFFAPSGEKVGSFANARRAALLAHKQAAAS